MSGLAALLAGHNPPDLYRWHNAAHVADVQHAVEHAGWRFVSFDGWTVEDRAGFLKGAASALALPDEASESLDAFAAGLGEVPDGDCAGLVLLWDGWGPLARADAACFEQARGCLQARARDQARPPFAVLLRGEGPDLDVPELPAPAHH
ncbi:MAG TPA: barstar family protein [Nocardioidaceae bacterium]|jgi:hypothetical protein|nr:barstar family protein [Nocardioidaceae bacterium]